MNEMKEAFKSFWGLAFTIVCGTVGCLALPPTFTNTWRLGIFVGLLACYVIGFLNGSKKKTLEAVGETKSLEDRLAGKQAALDNERRKNAELARRWDELHSKERRILSYLRTVPLSYVRIVLRVFDKKSVEVALSSSLYGPCDALADAGCLDYALVNLGVGREFFLTPVCRKVVFEHEDELRLLADAQ